MDLEGVQGVLMLRWLVYRSTRWRRRSIPTHLHGLHVPTSIQERFDTGASSAIDSRGLNKVRCDSIFYILLKATWSWLIKSQVCMNTAQKDPSEIYQPMRAIPLLPKALMVDIKYSGPET